jgi:hypothetical protein
MPNTHGQSRRASTNPSLLADNAYAALMRLEAGKSRAEAVSAHSSGCPPSETQGAFVDERNVDFAVEDPGLQAG